MALRKALTHNLTLLRRGNMKCEGLIKVNSCMLTDIADWYKRRGLITPNSNMLSDMGYISDGRVAAWLYITNSGIAMIENVISDPRSIPSLRRQSLHKLLGFLIDMATALGYTTILGITKHEGMIDTVKKFGFTELKDYKLVTLVTQDE